MLVSGCAIPQAIFNAHGRRWSPLGRHLRPSTHLNLEPAAPLDVVWMGAPPARIDLMKGVPGGTFEPCWDARIRFHVDGVEVQVVCKSDLIRLKRASGRPQDLLDADQLDQGDSVGGGETLQRDLARAVVHGTRNGLLLGGAISCGALGCWCAHRSARAPYASSAARHTTRASFRTSCPRCPTPACRIPPEKGPFGRRAWFLSA